MLNLDTIGQDWLISEVDGLTEEIIKIAPSVFNEENRYLPASVTSIPGYIRFAVNPYMREILDCFDVDSDVREVNLKKGVQITWTTLIESILLYYMFHVKTLPMMYMTADKELAEERVSNNIIPMINQSGFADKIRSSDEGNSRKTGKTKNHIQVEGGAYMVPFGAQNAAKMRSYSIALMFKDELDAWPDVVGKDGDPDAISDDRCSGYWERRKIGRGSTPLIKGMSKIEDAYRRGDQRKYMVLCKACSFPQSLRWESVNKETGVVGGFRWEMEDGALLLGSVCYCCQSCGHPHYEHDKERLFSPNHGAHWKPTARPVEPNIRSYHLPALYSPIGMQPWYKSVSAYLQGYDPVDRKVIDIGKYQKFYNNVLAEPFEIKGAKVLFEAVSLHRRTVYRFGQIPNAHAQEHAGSRILFLTCQIDVHKSNLAVSVMGWAKDAKCYLIDYWRFEAGGLAEDCTELGDPVWGKVQQLIEETEYISDDGLKYKVTLTLIDGGYANDTVSTFCSSYGWGVFPILGRERPAKIQKISEFAEFKTQAGGRGYRILVDHYKDRIATALRREWSEGSGEQQRFHFNAPVDTTDAQIKELTVEVRQKKTDDRGNVSYIWYRPGNARNELWDLLVYGHAAVEILAWNICIQHFELETVEWGQFWAYMGEQLPAATT